MRRAHECVLRMRMCLLCYGCSEGFFFFFSILRFDDFSFWNLPSQLSAWTYFEPICDMDRKGFDQKKKVKAN